MPNLYFGVEHSSIPRSVLVWAHFTANGSKKIYRVNNRQNTQQYLAFLQTLLEDNADLVATNGSVQLVHDYNFVHQAKAVTQWLNAKETYEIIPWPRNFGDIMPLSKIFNNIWENLKGEKVCNEDELWNAIELSFYTLPDEYFKTLASNIPKQLNGVINCKGDWFYSV